MAQLTYSYNVYWHWDGIHSLENCSEAKAYSKFYSIHKGASRIIVNNNAIIESEGPTNQFKYMLACKAYYNGKLNIPQYKTYYVVYWSGCHNESFSSNKRDDAFIRYGQITKDASRAIIYNGKIIRNDGPSNEWKM
eukprot:355871_1